MKTPSKQINKLRNLLKNFTLGENSFIDFVNTYNKIDVKLKEEIENNYISLDSSAYSRYVSYYKNYLNSKVDVKINIDKWISKYNFKYFNLNSILFISNSESVAGESFTIKQSQLYNDLSEIINRQPCDDYADEYSELQTDFLNFTRVKIVEDVINYINDFKVDKIKSLEDYFINLKDDKTKLNKFLTSLKDNNKNGKGVQSPQKIGIMTALLVELKFIYISEGERNKFYRAWFNYVGETFKGGMNDVIDSSKNNLKVKDIHKAKYDIYKIFLNKIRSTDS